MRWSANSVSPFCQTSRRVTFILRLLYIFIEVVLSNAVKYAKLIMMPDTVASENLFEMYPMRMTFSCLHRTLMQVGHFFFLSWCSSFTFLCLHRAKRSVRVFFVCISGTAVGDVSVTAFLEPFVVKWSRRPYSLHFRCSDLCSTLVVCVLWSDSSNVFSQ